MAGQLAMVGCVLVGFCLGIIFFGGLWLTLGALPHSRHPAMLVIASLWGRTAVVVAGFVWVMRGRWQNALLCLVGFLAARLAMSRRLRLHKDRDEARGRYGNNA